MKTVSVRIKEEQAKRLQEFADCIPGFSVSGGAQRAMDLWLEIEGPVYLAAFKEAQRKMKIERQAVASERAAL